MFWAVDAIVCDEVNLPVKPVIDSAVLLVMDSMVMSVGNSSIVLVVESFVM